MKRCLSVDSPDYKALVEIMMDTYTEKLSAHDWAGMGRICIVSQDTCLLDLSTQTKSAFSVWSFKLTVTLIAMGSVLSLL